MTVTPYTRIPNAILEAIQSDDMSKIEAKLTIVLARETYGRHRDTVRLIWDEMQALAGISRASLNTAIDQVEQRGFFIRTRRSTWMTTIPNSSMDAGNSRENSTKSELNEDSNSTEIELNGGSNSSNFVLDDSSIFEPSSIAEKKAPKGAKKKKTPPTPPPDPELAAMVNALVDATGISARLNWAKMADLAGELLGENYTAAQVAQVYAPGGWWFTCDWRGQKGQLPGLTAVRETIRQGIIWDGQVPARASPNGNAPNLTRAEAAALEYAAMKEQLFRGDT